MKRTLKTKQKYWLGGALKGATSGASTGMVAGPWGAAAGALVGGVMGGIGQSQEEKAQQQAANMQQLQHRQVAQMNAMQPQQQYTPTFGDGGSLASLNSAERAVPNRDEMDGLLRKIISSGVSPEEAAKKVADSGFTFTMVDFNRFYRDNKDLVDNSPYDIQAASEEDRARIMFRPKITNVSKHHSNRPIYSTSDMQTRKSPFKGDYYVQQDSFGKQSVLTPQEFDGFTQDSRYNTMKDKSAPSMAVHHNVDQFKYGGRMKKYQQGGQFEEYGGQTHGGPDEGIPIGQSGSPQAQTQEQAVALTEDGEVRWNDYIFSNSIKLPGNKKRTFADEAKRIKGKYKLRLGKELTKKDPIDSPAFEDELNTLMELQETLKGNMIHQEDAQAMMQEQEQAMAAQMQQGQEQQMNPEEAMMQEQAMGQEMPMEQPMMKYGGKMPKYPTGGNFLPSLGANLAMPGAPQLQNSSTTGATVAGALNHGITGKASEVPFTGGVSPWAMAPSVIGNIAGMIGEKTRKDIPLNLGRIQAQRANLDTARQDVRGQAASARGSMGASMRQAGATGSQYMSGALAGNVATAGQAGSQLAGITTQEEQMNMQNINEANRINIHNRGLEAQAKFQQQAQSQDRSRQYRDSISQGVGQWASEDARSRQQAQLMGMMSDNYMYTQDASYNPLNPFSKRNMRRRMAPTNITQRG